MHTCINIHIHNSFLKTDSNGASAAAHDIHPLARFNTPHVLFPQLDRSIFADPCAGAVAAQILRSQGALTLKKV